MPTSLCFRSLRAAATLALAAAAACLTKDERSDLVLTKLVQPTAAAGCVLDPSSAESSHIRVDLTSAPEFAVGAVVENRLANNANVLTGRLNSNDFISRQARLHFEFPDSSYGGASIGDLIVPVSGVVPAAGRSALDIPALPYAAIQTLKAVALPASGRCTGAPHSSTFRCAVDAQTTASKGRQRACSATTKKGSP